MKENNIGEGFKFWCPINKAQDPVIDPTTGEEIMRLGGIASTSDEDSDGEFLDPKGFDIQPLLSSGLVNWHHQAKGQPATIIGEPSKAEIRPEGLYIETDLYPSSQIAHDVWELAKTLEKDSKTRRLGYSIEGRVDERKSSDRNSPDFNKIIKAVITGVAITHQPKNAQTFANIIKGELGNDFEEKEEEEIVETEEKAIDTESGEALKKESLDKEVKNQEFTKSQVMYKLFRDIPAITIEKAEKIYVMLNKLANMNKRKGVTQEDISKAYEALGLDIEENDLLKAEDCETIDGEAAEEEDISKSKEAESEDTKEDLETDKDELEDDEEDKDELEDDEVEDEEADEDEEDEPIKKGGFDEKFDILKKAIASSHVISSKYMKALGVMIKDVAQRQSSVLEENSQLSEIVKAQSETISALSDRIEEFGSEVPAPKSISSARPIERTFQKGFDSDLNRRPAQPSNQVSMSKNKTVVTNLLDQATFSKGYDDEFSKACLAFEASGQLPANIISRIKNEYGINIVD